MPKKEINYVNPYGSVALLYKEGMDYIIDSFTSSSNSSGENIEELVTCVSDYLIMIQHLDKDKPEDFLVITNTRIAVANAINGYLERGSESNQLKDGIMSVPVSEIGSYIDKFEDALGGARRMKSSKSSEQLSLSIGKASYEYWMFEIRNGSTSKWSSFFDGNIAIDNASIPYWVTASIFGTAFNYVQLNATDSVSAFSAFMNALGGGLVVGSAKVIFGLVPKMNFKSLNLDQVSEVLGRNPGGDPTPPRPETNNDPIPLIDVVIAKDSTVLVKDGPFIKHYNSYTQSFVPGCPSKT